MGATPRAVSAMFDRVPDALRRAILQRGFTKLNAYLTLKDADDRWELSLIGNNLNDVLRGGYCANTDLQNTTVFTRFAQVTGQATNPTGKIDDVACVVEPGRQIFIKLTLRPLGMFQ